MSPETQEPELAATGEDTIANKQMEKEPFKKKRNTSFNLSLSNTFYTSQRVCPTIHDHMEIGGWSCSKCNQLLDHDDCVGIPEAHGFKVYGYHCHRCDHRWLREKYKLIEERCGQSFMTMGKWEIKRTSTHTYSPPGEPNDGPSKPV